MTITKVIGIPQYISWNETFDISSIDITVKMGTNESFSNWVGIAGITFDSQIGSSEVTGFVSNLVVQRWRNSMYPGKIFSNPNDLLTTDVNWEGTGKVSIAKGASKTVRFLQPDITFGSGVQTVVTDFCTVHNADIYAGSTSANCKQWVKDEAGYTGQKIPISVWVEFYNYDTPSRRYYAVKRNIGYFIDYYNDPTADTFDTTSDTYSDFGAFMLGKGVMPFLATFTLDSVDPTLTATHNISITKSGESDPVVYTVETTAGASSVGIDIPMPAQSGTYNVNYIVVDSHGNMSIPGITKQIVVLPYFDPTITELTGRDILERYSVVQREGELQPVEEHDELGRTLWFNADVNAYQTPTGYPDNQWALNLYLGNETIPVVRWDSEDIELPLHYENSHVPFGDRDFLPGQKYIFTLKLTDYFHQGDNAIVIGNIVVEAGTGYFNIEKNGVAIGMLSTATSDEKKTESAYPIFPYGGIVGLNFYPENEQKVGTYIDGKPLYSRTFVKESISHTSSATNTTIDTIADLENVAWLIGVKKQLDGYFNPLPYYYNSSQYGYCYVNPSGSVIFWHSDGSGSAKCDVLVTVWYTKTTDTVVSE